MFNHASNISFAPNQKQEVFSPTEMKHHTKSRNPAQTYYNDGGENSIIDKN